MMIQPVKSMKTILPLIHTQLSKGLTTVQSVLTCLPFRATGLVLLNPPEGVFVNDIVIHKHTMFAGSGRIPASAFAVLGQFYELDLRPVNFNERIELKVLSEKEGLTLDGYFFGVAALQC